MCILNIVLRRMSYDNLTLAMRFRHFHNTCVTLHSDQFSQTNLNRIDKHDMAKKCARRSIHRPTKMCSETPCATTTDNRSVSNDVETLVFVAGTIASFDKAYSSIRPSSGLADRRAHHCGMRIEPVQVPMSHHTYTLGIHLRNSATVESNLSACGKP